MMTFEKHCLGLPPPHAMMVTSRTGEVMCICEYLVDFVWFQP